MTTTAAAPPLFGVRKKPERTVPFQLRSYSTSGVETDHQFEARCVIDAGTALAASRSSSAGASASYIEKFLIRVLLDSDGVGQKEEPVPVTEDDDAEPGTDLVRSEAFHLGEWEVDGQSFPSRDLAVQHADKEGSSLRRFAKLMDDPFEIIELDALTEVFTYLLEQTGQRPTVRSSPSPRRRTQKPRR